MGTPLGCLPSTSNPSLSDRPIEKEEKNDGWLRSIRGDCALIEIEQAQTDD